MKLYKFKDLREPEKHPHFYQIVLENSIWCAKPDSLNDDDEFKFELDYRPSTATANLLSKVVKKYGARNYSHPHSSIAPLLKNNRLKEIMAPIKEDMINRCRNEAGIVSFSLTKDDEYLWDEYGGKGNGVRIEINISDDKLHKTYHPVQYVTEKVFHVDSFFESTLDENKVSDNYKMMLATKIRRWKQEKEIRVIAKQQEINMPIDGYISEVTFGTNIPEDTLKQVKDQIIDHCNANDIIISKRVTSQNHHA